MLLRAKEPKYRRESGILLPLSALPSEFGIGSFGREAYRFVDFLRKSRQTYWQLLPLCPVGAGNSPYSSPCSFAGEILAVDLEKLVNDGLLEASELGTCEPAVRTDYQKARAFKIPLLRKAAARFSVRSRDFLKFERENKAWLSDFALFSAIREENGGRPFTEWEDGLKYRLPAAVEAFKREHTQELLFYKITQYFFYSQFRRLKEYAEKNRVKLIGDIPFYVSWDSADVWANPDAFRLGRDLKPVLMAGVPPDVFSESGQLWGNPVYDWAFQKKTDYFWWRSRLLHNARLYDVLRIDHFRAFADAYMIPFGAADARSGSWEKSVGMPFWSLMKQNLGKLTIIAEDLGGDTPEVRKLIRQTGFPGMKVLQFAFDSDLKNPFLPRNYPKNCVCYTGTHDNDTTRGWLQSASRRERLFFERLVPADRSGSPVFSLIRFGMKSRARIVIVPMQDYLCLDSSARFNLPGTARGNWEWRLAPDALTDTLAETVRRLSAGRN